MVQKREEYIVDAKGKRIKVLLDIKQYHEILEDPEDLRILVERKDEATSPLEEVEARLKARGLL